MGEQGFLVPQSLIDRVQRHDRWINNLRVTGADFRNDPSSGAAINIPPRGPATRGGGDGGARFCLVVQNGVDGSSNPTYDIYGLGDIGHTQKLNVGPVEPENWRKDGLTYVAGSSGIYQRSGDNIFLFVCDEAPNC